MRSIFILYMPGHAGNFLNRLFSLSNKVFPQLTQRDLDNAINTQQLNPGLKEFSFEQVRETYTSWQQFHRDFVDFANADKVELLNQICGNKFTHAVYAIHPCEFAQQRERVIKTKPEIYHVELDSSFNQWVEESRKELKFVTRDNEEDLFNQIIASHSTTSISLTRMLLSESDFCSEYIRVCKLMQITPLIDQAMRLYRDWKLARVDYRAPHVKKSLQSVKLFSRAPSDEFTFSLFNNLLSGISHNYEAYYAWSNPPENLSRFIKTLTPTAPNVVLGLKDLLDMWKDFNWWKDSVQEGSALLIDLANKYPEKNFIVFTSLENLSAEIGSVPNIQLINWGGDLLNQHDLYPTLTPVLDKNFDSSRTFISLNRNPRLHRLVLLSYLFGTGYTQYGTVSYLGQQIVTKEQNDLLDVMPWKFDMERHVEIRDRILSGYKQVYNNKTLSLDNYRIYQTVNNNVANFDQSLRTRYRNSFVEIVTESSFSAPAYLLTEKYLNSVYGCNFPILLSGVGAVEHLRQVGFDMFDDVVDHSYDLVSNPLDRIITAIELNKELLMDSDYVKQLWKEHRLRFEQNVTVAKTKMYDWYQHRAVAQFSAVTWN